MTRRRGTRRRAWRPGSTSPRMVSTNVAAAAASSSAVGSSASSRVGQTDRAGREGDPLLLAAGQLGRDSCTAVGEADGRRAAPAPRPAVDAAEPRRQLDLLDGAQVGDEVVGRVLEHDAEPCGGAAGAASGRSRVMSQPSISTSRRPRGRCRPASTRSSDDLPDPDGPATTVSRPRSNAASTSSERRHRAARAGTPRPARSSAPATPAEAPPRRDQVPARSTSNGSSRSVVRCAIAAAIHATTSARQTEADHQPRRGPQERVGSEPRDRVDALVRDTCADQRARPSPASSRRPRPPPSRPGARAGAAAS